MFFFFFISVFSSTIPSTCCRLTSSWLKAGESEQQKNRGAGKKWPNKSKLCVSLPLLPTRQQVSCQCTCSWSATQQRRCTGPIRASIGLASATAQITPASSSIQTRGPDVVAVLPPSPLRLLSRWTPPTTLPSSNVQSMNKCLPHLAETEDEWLFWCRRGHFWSDWIFA